MEIARELVKLDQRRLILEGEFRRLAGEPVVEFAPVDRRRSDVVGPNFGQRILTALACAPARAYGAREIMGLLSEPDMSLNRENVYRSTLHKLWSSGDVERPSRGLYCTCSTLALAIDRIRELAEKKA